MPLNDLHTQFGIALNAVMRLYRVVSYTEAKPGEAEAHGREL